MELCDNFYEYTCGNFLKTAKIPGNDKVYGHFTNDTSEIERKLRESLEKSVTSSDSVSIKKLKFFYQTCIKGGNNLLLNKFFGKFFMNGFHRIITQQCNFFLCLGFQMTKENKFDQFVEIYKNISKVAGGWPVISGESWNVSHRSWISLVGQFRKLGSYGHYFIEYEPAVFQNALIVSILMLN